MRAIHSKHAQFKCLCRLFPLAALMEVGWGCSLSRRPTEHGKSLSTAYKRHTLKTLLAGGVKLVKVLQRLEK